MKYFWYLITNNRIKIIDYAVIGYNVFHITLIQSNPQSNSNQCMNISTDSCLAIEKQMVFGFFFEPTPLLQNHFVVQISLTCFEGSCSNSELPGANDSGKFNSNTTTDWSKTFLSQNFYRIINFGGRRMRENVAVHCLVSTT